MVKNVACDPDFDSVVIYGCSGLAGWLAKKETIDRGRDDVLYDSCWRGQPLQIYCL